MNERNNALLLGSASLDALGGIYFLGRGLNQLSWAEKGTACGRVLDTTRDPRTKKIGNEEYEVGSSVEYTPKTGSSTHIHVFTSSADYHKQSSVNANASGSYGAFSGGFEGAFTQGIEILNDHYAAVYSHTEQLWALHVAITEANLHADFLSDVKTLPDFLDDYSNVDVFIDFFMKYGVDVITQVTAGGSLTCSILVNKDSENRKTDLSATVRAQYGNFVANASTSISEELKKQAQEQNVTVKALGGTAGIDFNPDQPRNCNADFVAWRKSLPQSPRVVDVVLTAIDQVLPAKYEKQKTALAKARKWYTHYEATILADWQSSHIEVVNARTAGANAAPNGQGKPALHIVIVGKDRRARVDTRLTAPDRSASPEAFAAFWQSASAVLTGVKEPYEIAMVATERWPRDLRYYPSGEMYTQLRQQGASQQTLERWKKLVQDAQPCGIAGMTYVLAGKGLPMQITDWVTAGFGIPDQDNIRPTIRVTARFVHDGAKETRMLITHSTEQTNTALYIIANRDGDKLALASGKKDKTRIEMVGADPRKDDAEVNLGQFWYLLPWSRPYKDILHPHILINLETCACLQGKLDRTECRLLPFGDDGRVQQDDVIWDVRDSVPTHFLLVHDYYQNMDLTQVDRTASVRHWRENYMIWSMREIDNLHW